MPNNLSQVAGIGLLLADGNLGQFEITVIDAQVVTEAISSASPLPTFTEKSSSAGMRVENILALGTLFRIRTKHGVSH